MTEIGWVYKQGLPMKQSSFSYLNNDVCLDIDNISSIVIYLSHVAICKCSIIRNVFCVLRMDVVDLYGNVIAVAR